MRETDPLLAPTRLLDFEVSAMVRLIEGRGWEKLPRHERIGTVYHFVRNEIAFGYNRADDITASELLGDGYGQCNTMGTLLTALPRGTDMRCRLHGFTIHKAPQRGAVPELGYSIAPAEILHSWVEAEDGRVNLESFILDAPFLGALQQTFPGTDCLNAPPIGWTCSYTDSEKSGIAPNFGTLDTPGAFYSGHRQKFGRLHDWLYRLPIRHWINACVRAIRAGRVPRVPGPNLPNHRHDEVSNAT